MPYWVQERLWYSVISKGYTAATSQMDVDYAASGYDQLNIDVHAGYILPRTIVYYGACPDCGPAGITGSGSEFAIVLCSAAGTDLWGIQEEMRMEV